MFKKILAACAGVVLSSGSVLAVDVSGVYSGQSNGQNLSVTLNDQGGTVHGQVAIGGGMLPLVGRENNGQIQGTWRNSAGQDIPFTAVAGANGLQIQTHGMSYSLARSGDSSPSPVGAPDGGRFAPPPGQGDAAGAANVPAGDAGQLQLQTRQGRVMQADIPAGWSFSDTTNGIDTSAPDGVTYVSHTWLRGVGRCNPDMYLQNNMKMWPKWGMTQVQVISSKAVNAQSKLYEMQYSFHGRPAHAMVQVSVNPAPQSYMAEMVMVQTAPESFQQRLQQLVAIAKSVRVTDNNAFCDNGKINGEIQKRYAIQAKSQAEIADIRNSSNAYRSHVQDQMSLQNSDYIRDQTRFNDDSGTQYTGPLQAQRAFKHNDGTITYSPNSYDPVPSDATELNNYQYK